LLRLFFTQYEEIWQANCSYVLESLF